MTDYQDEVAYIREFYYKAERSWWRGYWAGAWSTTFLLGGAIVFILAMDWLGKCA